MTHGALRRGACCGRVRGIGAAGSGPRPMRYRARGSGPGCPATCGESPHHPWPPPRGTALLRSRSPCSSRASFASLGLGRSAWRAEGAPLMTREENPHSYAPEGRGLLGTGNGHGSLRPVEPCPDRAGCVVAVDAPLVWRQRGRCPGRGAGPGRSFPGSTGRRCLRLRSGRSGLGLTAARTVKVPSGRRERLCRAALAASSEAQRITSSALRAVSEECAQVGADCADVLGAARIGDVGGA